MKIMIHSQFSIAPNKRNKVCSLHLWNDQQYNENKQTFTNCWRGALGFLDVVSRILGSFSAANAYSSSMWVFGTEFTTSQSIKTHKFTKHNNYWMAQIRENMMGIVQDVYKRERCNKNQIFNCISRSYKVILLPLQLMDKIGLAMD
jgi:hypothetical protein